MSTYEVKLKSREEVAVGTMAFRFEKPEGFDYKAGQYGDFTLIDPEETDDEGNVRSFTIASAPYEDSVMITTRMRDTAFKRNLKTMKLGAQISLDGPNGEFILHNDESIPAVFLTGGIGVTPVRSILLQAVHDKLPYQIAVFYSNRRPEDAAYLQELMQLGREHPNIKIVPSMSEMDKSNADWFGETGMINQPMLKRYIDDLKAPIYYIDGPPEMVKGMKKLLSEANVSDENVKTEDFDGY